MASPHQRLTAGPYLVSLDYGAAPRYRLPMSELPILYSFRRCPYAMRARMALASAQVHVTLREVLLKAKPAELIAVSPKATVPVLALTNGSVLEESRQIMNWALTQCDPLGWCKQGGFQSEWIEECDTEFKPWLDRYKYADRHPDHPAGFYREQGALFVSKINCTLETTDWLCGEQPSVADVAVFPFIRQFAAVDARWWRQSPYTKTRIWLDNWLRGDLFSSVMGEYAQWQPGQPEVRFPG